MRDTVLSARLEALELKQQTSDVVHDDTRARLLAVELLVHAILKDDPFSLSSERVAKIYDNLTVIAERAGQEVPALEKEVKKIIPATQICLERAKKVILEREQRMERLDRARQVATQE